MIQALAHGHGEAVRLERLCQELKIARQTSNPAWELDVADPLVYFFYWLGLSIGMHAFPSTHDLNWLWQLAPGEARKANWLAIISLPLIGILYVLNFLRVVWADLGYGIAVGILGPLAIFKALS